MRVEREEVIMLDVPSLANIKNATRRQKDKYRSLGSAIEVYTVPERF